MSAKVEKTEKKYCKEQLVRSGDYPKDLAAAVLKDGTEYTAEEAAAKIRNYYEREVR